VDLVLLQDPLTETLIHAPRQRDRRVECDPARLFLLEVDPRGPAVEAHPHGLELPREDGAVRGGSRRVQDHQQQVGRLAHGDDLPAAPLAVGGALDDAGQVEQLDLGVVVADDARDARERRELVGRRLGGRSGQDGQQGGLADRGEADERDAAVAVLLHLEAVARAAAGALGGLLQLRSELCQLGLQLT
jgi:hypothetical protein